jgi:hypothetical protein
MTSVVNRGMTGLKETGAHNLSRAKRAKIFFGAPLFVDTPDWGAPVNIEGNSWRNIEILLALLMQAMKNTVEHHI